jgi:hypothetical protein
MDMAMKEKLDFQIKIKTAYFKDNVVDEIVNVKSSASIFRIYENDMIYISYVANSEDDDYGYYIAEKNGAKPYSHTTTLNIQKNVIFEQDTITDRKLVDLLEVIGKSLYAISSSFIIKYEGLSERYTLSNINKLHMNSECGIHKFTLIYNDSNIVFEYKKIDESNIISDMKRVLSLEIKKPIKTDIKKIIIPTNIFEIYDFFEEILSADYVIENNLIDRKLFSEDFTLYTSLNEDDTKSRKYGLLPFFDWEGSNAPYYRTSLIENGVIVRAYTNKDMSQKYDIENTSCAYAINSDYPSCNLLGAYIEPSNKNLDELAVDRAILVENADIHLENEEIIIETKNAYLYEKSNLTEKVQNFKLKINPYRLFGEKFLGVSKDFLFNSDTKRGIVFEISDIEYM